MTEVVLHEEFQTLLRLLPGRRVLGFFGSVFSGDGSVGTYEIVLEGGPVRSFTWGHGGVDVYNAPIFESNEDWGSFTREELDVFLVGQVIQAVFVRVRERDGVVCQVYVEGEEGACVCFELVLASGWIPDGLRLRAPCDVPESDCVRIGEVG